MKFKFLKVALTSLILCANGFANAGLIQVGTLPSYAGDCTINCTPLLQQVYGSSNFTVGDSTITSISFFAGAGNWSAGNNYEIWLSEFAPGVGNLTNSWSSNLGASAVLFDTIQIGNTTNGQAVTWSGNFSYNLSAGDLLVSVRNTGAAGGAAMYASSDGTKQRAYSFSSNTAQSMNVNRGNYGLVTRFTTSASTDVPEPSTLAIFALGLMGLASRRFKKQS